MEAHEVRSDAIALCRETLEHHSKSFAFAAKFLPSHMRDDAAVVYAWCRYVDDEIDEGSDPHGALVKLRTELDAIYEQKPIDDIVQSAFQQVAKRCAIPKAHSLELLAGMEMDLIKSTYADLQELLLYCHRVAGVVGWMMCQVMGMRRDAMREAACLGIAMQLTNICRDVEEDWSRGRLYLPLSMLRRAGYQDTPLRNDKFPIEAKEPFACVVRELLDIASDFYQLGEQGLSALPPRCAFAIAAASRIYSAIGTELSERDFDVTKGRAFVSLPKKSMLASQAIAFAARSRSHPLNGSSYSAQREASFPEDVLTPAMMRKLQW